MANFSQRNQPWGNNPQQPMSPHGHRQVAPEPGVTPPPQPYWQAPMNNVYGRHPQQAGPGVLPGLPHQAQNPYAHVPSAQPVKNTAGRIIGGILLTLVGILLLLATLVNLTDGTAPAHPEDPARASGEMFGRILMLAIEGLLISSGIRLMTRPKRRW